jgi:outer membrane protein OmpA-like peptidoglycan-associated protein
MKKLLLISLLTALSTGCSTWPEEGRGGWAEHYHPDAPKNTDGYENALPFQVMNEYEHLSLKLDWLKSRGIKNCMPGQLYQAEMSLNRINRTIAAQMYSQAQLDMRTFYHQVKQLQNHFERVISATQCVSNETENSEDFNNKIDELLNSDNQFAFDSAKVTPKYMVRLSQAAELLKMSQETQVLLVGHTDKEGEKLSNYELAYKRAENVKQWLVLYGVKTEQVDTRAQGEMIPYSDLPESKSKQHSDRRVNAYIISRSSKAAKLNKVKPLKEWTQALESKEQ